MKNNEKAIGKIINLPNFLTLLRFLLLPIFAFFAVSKRPIPAAIIIAVMALLDILDGYLARKLKVSTKFGQLFDIFVDTTTMISVFAILMLKNYLPLWALVPLGLFIGSGLVSIYLFHKYNFIGKTTFLADFVGVMAYMLIIAALFGFLVTPIMIVETVLILIRIVEYFSR